MKIEIIMISGERYIVENVCNAKDFAQKSSLNENKDKFLTLTDDLSINIRNIESVKNI